MIICHERQRKRQKKIQRKDSQRRSNGIYIKRRSNYLQNKSTNIDWQYIKQSKS